MDESSVHLTLLIQLSSLKVAMLLGPNAPIVFEPGMRVSHMEHVYDFYKPDLHSEYPEVDGPLSNACYIKAVDTCYSRFVDKVVNLNNSGEMRESERE